MPDKGNNKTPRKQWDWTLGIVLVVAGTVLTYAVQAHNWRLAQVASIAGVIFLGLGLVFLTKTLSSQLYPLTPHPTEMEGKRDGTDAKEKAGEIRDMLLRRLVMVAGFGLGIVFLYSVQHSHWPEGRVLSTLSVGLISAGAAWLVGALLGFLFGIPHTLQNGVEPSKSGTASAEARAEQNRYAPSTSLEQISDWLTKIIVGVGLTQLSNIPHKLDQLARYISSGLDNKSGSGFALGIIVYFSVCGFLFGYLWGRLYMLGLFREADLEKRLEKVEEISSQILDQRAKDLVERQLDPSASDVEPSRINEAIEKASEDERDEILELVRDARKGDEATDTTKRRAIPVLEALIQADVAGLVHTYHGELGYIRFDLGQLEDAISELTTAIDIRDRRGKSGWKDLEYRRARARIRLAKMAGAPTPEARALIRADIDSAFSDPKHRVRFQQNREIKDWLDSEAPPAGAPQK